MPTRAKVFGSLKIINQSENISTLRYDLRMFHLTLNQIDLLLLSLPRILHLLSRYFGLPIQEKKADHNRDVANCLGYIRCL